METPKGGSQGFGKVHAVHQTEQGLFFSVHPFRRVAGSTLTGPCPFHQPEIAEAFLLWKSWTAEVLPTP